MPIEITDDDLTIEICRTCHGRKRVEQTTRTSPRSSHTEEVDCEACGGRGLKLTPTGAKLFDFVREASRWSSF
jgi:DnaJ-class molecular chaperone